MSGVRGAMASCLRLSVFGMIFALAAVVGLCSVVAWQVTFGDYTSLKKSTILAKIKEETTLYYLDEKTRIGSIFESRHRKYVPIEEIPAHMINAIVAAEDKNFYDHVGVDPVSIAKAAVEGVLAGGQFRRGGSTITQQTVKNIIDDWEASFARKFREMIKALQLERMYSKRQILEFYLNQFHVAGNGSGLGIAAKYYFSKDVQDLSLVEAAFIAGSVKGPSKYNPFIKYSKKARAKAKGYANERKNYVLRRMFEQGWISQEDYKEGVVTRVPFNRGEFRTSEVALVELVKSQLRKEEALKALGLKSVDDLNVSGLRVYTTIDSDLQRAAQLAMRKNLSRIETILNGFSPEPDTKMKPVRHLKTDEFYYGRIESIEGTTTQDYRLKLSFGLPTGEIPNASLVRYAKLLDLSEGKGWKRQMEKMIEQLKVGDVLFTHIVEYKKETNHAVCELRKRPKLSGGMIALDKGEVRAVVSGFDTLGFNRAMHAKRQAGSVFKSLVFFGALQLGWSVLDKLDNGRQVFSYQGKFYFPRPEHPTPYDETSMLWSNVMSENLASVAIGARLLDKLSFDDFKVVLNGLGLHPKPGELPRDFHYRISREVGVSLDRSGYKAYQLRKTIDAMGADLIFAGHDDLLKTLKRMWWGNGYIDGAKMELEDTETKLTRRELATRISLLENNYRRYRLLSESAHDDWNFLSQVVARRDPALLAQPEVVEVINRFRVLTTSVGYTPELGYYRRFEDEQYSEETFDDLIRVSGRALNQVDILAIWGQGDALGDHGRADVELADLKLGGILPLETLDRLDQMFQERYERFEETSRRLRDPYQLKRYFSHHDFRIGLGLYYLVHLAKHAGVFNHLEPVLSFPLGSNDVTVSEVAKIFQTFISGRTYRFYDDGPHNQISFIRRIEDRFGNVLYEPRARVHQLVRPEIAHQMREVLGKTVTHGTARRARGELFVEYDGPKATLEDQEDSDDDKPLRIRVPAFGKTGSTNEWKTSYFAGFFPYPTEQSKPLHLDNSYVISTYVGYDLNKTMRRGRLRIYGGDGALPLWIDFAKQIVKLKDYGSFVDPFDLNVIAHKEWPIENIPNPNSLLVDLPRGVVLRAGEQSDVETWSTTDIDKTGEVYHDLFAPGSSVRSVVQLPSLGFSAARPLGLVAPFVPGAENLNRLPFPLPTDIDLEDSQLDEESVSDLEISKHPTIAPPKSMGGEKSEDIW